VSGFTPRGVDPGGPNPNFQLDLGSVLERTFRIWFGNLISFSIVGFLVYLPAVLAYAGLAVAGKNEFVLVVAVLSGVLSIVLTGGVTYGVIQELHGHTASVGELTTTGFSRLLQAFGAGLLVFVSTILGCCAGGVPGLIVLTIFWLAVPIAVIESPGVFSSLSRSGDLTQGNRWSVFALALILWLLTFAASIIISVAVTALSVAIGAASRGDGPGQGAVSQVFVTLLGIPFQCLGAVAPAVVYHDLRVGKEGVEVDELLKVFE
jgi:hypothetical protein